MVEKLVSVQGWLSQEGAAFACFILLVLCLFPLVWILQRYCPEVLDQLKKELLQLDLRVQAGIVIGVLVVWFLYLDFVCSRVWP